VLAAGALYPIMYLRQNFEISLIEALGITASDLGDLNFILGVVFAVSYIPSGILADTLQPRVLMSFALTVVGLLGFWLSTYPSLMALKMIFFGWGMAGGMCFWAALLKAVNLLAKSTEQGRFFAILDGGRGLVEAILASIAILMFRELSAVTDPGTVRMQPVIWLYASTAIVLGALVFFVVQDNPAAVAHADGERGHADYWAWARNLWALVKLPQLWLLGCIIMLGQTLFFLTYSISAFLQVNLGLTALAAGSVTLSKLWMRPIAGFTIGFVADRYSRETVLGWLMCAASISLLCIIFLPLGGNLYLIMPLILVIGYLTYAIKGLYWSLLDLCHIPPRLLGLAIGIASFLGYMPDTLLPLYDGFLSRHFPRDESFRIYFSSIVGCGFLGAALCLVFLRWTRRAARLSAQNLASNPRSDGGSVMRG
jgi:sugar phosphate permease